MNNFFTVFLFLIVQLLFIHRLASGQILPSYPDEKIYGYEIPKISDEVKSIIETMKIQSDESDSLEISRIIMSHFYRNGKIKRVDFINNELKKIDGSVYFDTHGRIINRENTNSDYEINFSYDDENGISKKIRTEPDVYGIKYNVIQYDLELLKPKVEKRYRSKDMLIDSTVYRYNSKGDILAKIVYNTSGYGIILDSSFTGGKERKDVIPNDTTRFEYEYNNEGKIKSKTIFRRQDIYEKYTYSQQGDTLITNKMGFSQFREVTKEFENTTIEFIYLNSRYYDDIKRIYKNDRLTALIRFKDGMVTNRINHSYEISKDTYGNCIIMKHFQEGEIVNTINREIKYWN